MLDANGPAITAPRPERASECTRPGAGGGFAAPMPMPAPNPGPPRPARQAYAVKLFGYDLFVSFALGPGPRGTRNYAVDLVRRLRELDFTVFLSEDETTAADNLSMAIRQGLDRSKAMLVIANRGTLLEPRWVRTEVEYFKQRHPTRPVMLVNVEHALEDAQLRAAALEWLDFDGKIWVDESASSVSAGAATDAAVMRIAVGPRRTKVHDKWKWSIGALLLSFAALTTWSLNSAWQARLSAQQAKVALAKEVVQRGIAQDQRKLADAAKIEERTQKEIANKKTALAREAERKMAEELRVSTSAQLAGQNPSLRSGRRTGGTERAWLQLAAAHRLAPSADTESNILAILLQNRNLESLRQIRAPGRILAMTIDGSRVAYLDVARLVRLWDVAAEKDIGQPLQGVMPSSPLFFSPDGNLMVGFHAFSGLLFWDARSARARPDSGKAKPQLLANVQSAAFSGDGTRIAAGDANGAMALWDARNGEAIGTPIRAMKASITSIALNFDGTRIATATKDNVPDSENLYLWDMVANRSIPLLGHVFGVLSVTFNGDGKRLFSGGADNTLRQWDGLTGGKFGKPMQGPGGVTHIAVDPLPGSGRIAASFGPDQDETILVWNGTTGSRVNDYPWTGHIQGVQSLSFTADGKQLIALSGDASLRRWDTSVNRTFGQVLRACSRRKLDIEATLGFSSDSKRVLINRHGRAVCEWDASEATLIGDEALQGASRPVSRQNLFIRDEGVVLRAGATNALMRSDSHAEEDHAAEQEWTPKPTPARVLGVSKNGERVITADWGRFGSPDTPKSSGFVMRLWNGKTGELMWENVAPTGGALRKASFGADQQSILTGDATGTVALFSADGKLKRRYVFPAQGDQITSIAMSVDGKRVAAGNASGRLAVWHTHDSKLIGATRQVPGEELTSIAFSTDGHRMAMGSRTGKIGLWDVDRNLSIDPLLYLHNGRVEQIAFSADGKRIASLSANGIIVWSDPSQWIDMLCGKLTRNLSHEEWQQWISSTLPYQRPCATVSALTVRRAEGE